MIDEDQPSRNYLSALLGRHGYSVQAATSGKEGFINVLRDRPDVVIVDSSLTDITAPELVRKLRGDKRSSDIVFIALAPASGQAQNQEMLAAGCNHLFVKSLASIEKLLTFLADPNQVLANGVQKKQRSSGMLAVFLGAKGGMGTSSLCANIARSICAGSRELDVVVMDMVFPIGSLASIVGSHADFDILNAAALPTAEMNKAVLRRALPPLDNWHFRFLAGFPDPESAESVDAARLPGIAQAFRQSFDLTLIDIGCSLSSASLAIIQDADVVVIVTGNDLATINLTRIVWQYLQRKQINLQNVYFLINHSMGMAGLGKSDVEGILGHPIRAMVPYLGESFALANNQHLPISVKLTDDTISMILRQVSEEILETARRNRV